MISLRSFMNEAEASTVFKKIKFPTSNQEAHAHHTSEKSGGNCCDHFHMASTHEHECQLKPQQWLLLICFWSPSAFYPQIVLLATHQSLLKEVTTEIPYLCPSFRNARKLGWEWESVSGTLPDREYFVEKAPRRQRPSHYPTSSHRGWGWWIS